NVPGFAKGVNDDDESATYLRRCQSDPPPLRPAAGASPASGAPVDGVDPAVSVARRMAEDLPAGNRRERELPHGDDVLGHGLILRRQRRSQSRAVLSIEQHGAA